MSTLQKIFLSVLGIVVVAGFAVLVLSLNGRSTEIFERKSNELLGLLEDGVATFESYESKSPVSGNVVVTVLEKLKSSDVDIPILVITNGGATIAEYTNKGATETPVTVTSGGSYHGASLPAFSTVPTGAVGNYTDRNDVTYINPKLTYGYKCYYTKNKTLAFIIITQE